MGACRSFGVIPVCPGCRGDLARKDGSHRCTACGADFPWRDEGVIDLRLSSARTRDGLRQEEIWDRAAEGAPSTPVDGLACRNDHKSILFRDLSDRLRWPGAGSHTVDLGCFDGSLSRNWTQRYGTRIVGVDASLRPILRARRFDPFANEYHLAALEALPFRDASFDAVLSLDVLEHLGDPFPALCEADRVLRHGAPFLFYVVSSRGAGSWDWVRYHARRLAGEPVEKNYGDDPEGGHWAENLVDPRAFRSLLSATRLRLEGIRACHSFFGSVLDDIVRPWIVGRRARSAAAEPPAAVRLVEGRQAVLPEERISPRKRARLRWVARAFRAADLLDAPWRALEIGRGFAAWGRKRS